MLPFCSVAFRRKRNGCSPCPRMETGRAEADATENAVDYSNHSQHENDASKRRDRIWRRSVSIGDVRSIDSRQQTSNPVEPRSQNSLKIEERQQRTAPKQFRRPQPKVSLGSSLETISESTSWPSFFCSSKDHAQLLIMHACIPNGWHEWCNGV